MPKARSKRYQAALKLIDQDRDYPIAEGIDAIKSTSFAKFDGSVELHVNLGIDPQKAEQKINLTTTLPHSTGRTVRVIAIAKGDDARAAEKAGADAFGGVELIEKISDGWLEFDAVVATPDLMPEVAKIARILGPKGLMPSPKNETVSADVATAVENLKKGQLTLKSGEEAVLHVAVGKVSQDTAEIAENITHVLKLLTSNKPSGMKNELILSVYVAPTMGPSARLAL